MEEGNEFLRVKKRIGTLDKRAGSKNEKALLETGYPL